MSTPIVLTDNFLLDLMGRPEVAAVFPELQAYQQRIKNQTKGKGCTSCTRNDIVEDVVEHARQFLISMPDAQRQKLKTLLGVPGRKFLTYRRKKGGPFERVEV